MLCYCCFKCCLLCAMCSSLEGVNMTLVETSFYPVRGVSYSSSSLPVCDPTQSDNTRDRLHNFVCAQSQLSLPAVTAKSVLSHNLVCAQSQLSLPSVTAKSALSHSSACPQSQLSMCSVTARYELSMPVVTAKSVLNHSQSVFNIELASSIH